MISLAVIFGFRNQSYSESNKFLLFDACFDYLNSKSTVDSIDLKQDLSDLAEGPGNVLNSKLIPAVPDSTEKPVKPVKNDSVKIHLPPEDSLRNKAKQDSLKSIENLAKDSTKIKNSKLVPAVPDSTLKPMQPLKKDTTKIQIPIGSYQGLI